MSDKVNNLQDVFLNSLRRSKSPVTIFLVKGVKLQGIVTWFDNFSLLLRRDGQAQLVYKHAISTVMPGHFDPRDLPAFNGKDARGGRDKSLQQVFLGAVLAGGEPVTMFLVNGVMLQGRITHFDLFSILLERDGHYQLVYKHAVSTVQPQSTVDLAEFAAERGDTGGNSTGSEADEA